MKLTKIPAFFISILSVLIFIILKMNNRAQEVTSGKRPRSSRVNDENK